jgi:LuxR family maltose regulon positive regulatory protein
MSPPVFPVILAQCRLQAHDGDPGVAEQIALIGTFTSQSTPAPFMLLICELLVGELLLKCGELSEATRWMHAGFTRLASLPDAGILRPRLERLRDLLDQRRLLEPLTPAERRVLEFLPTELSLKQIASRLWVSHETVHTHVQDIYRKLEVHARSEAVARARDLELLSS